MNKLRVRKNSIKKWVEALRSGKYAQGYGGLQNGDTFCCLGVACDVLVPTYMRNHHGELAGGTPATYRNAPPWLTLISEDVALRLGESLITLNDMGNFTFDEIADILELVYIHGAA